MKKIFVIVAIVATMILSASCNNRKPAEPVLDATEVVDSLNVAVDSAAVDAPVEEVVAE